jgi:hypothetical protein
MPKILIPAAFRRAFAKKGCNDLISDIAWIDFFDVDTRATTSSTVKPSTAKRIKMSVDQNESSLLSMLDSDSLRSVLIRVPAEDHDNLRLTCKSTQANVDSSQFKRERNRLEWVETKATVVSPGEHYEKNFPIEEDEMEPHELITERAERERLVLSNNNDLSRMYGRDLWIYRGRSKDLGGWKTSWICKTHARPPTASWSNFS